MYTDVIFVTTNNCTNMKVTTFNITTARAKKQYTHYL